MLGTGTTEEFFANEFSILNLNDKRLNNRATQIGMALQKRPTSCIKRLFIEKKDMRQAYDFFCNPKVSGEALLKAHYHETVVRARAAKSSYILAIQDKTTLDFTTHKAKTELGRIGGRGKNTNYGLFQHNTLLVTMDNEPLGLINVEHFDYDDYDLTIDHHERPIEEKHTFNWITSSEKRRKRLGELSVPIITVADRESDIFEFLHDLIEHNEDFVVRAQHDRFTGEHYSKYAEKLFSLFEKESDLGVISTHINDVNTHEIREITLHFKSLKSVTLPPTRYLSKEKYQPITLNVVMAYNNEICWILLTNLSVDTLQDCEQVTKIYKARWHVEDFHKILKTAYQIDEIYLHSSRQAILSAMALLSISACRLYWIIYVGRVDPECKADALFAEYEWKTPYIYLKEPTPEQPPQLTEVIIQIARMGGYKVQKKAPPPGIKSMWLGFQALGIASEMYKNILSRET